MSGESIEKRVAALEAEVSELKKLVKKDAEPWWQKIIGTFRDDPYYERAMKYGRQYRESLRPKPRKKKRKPADGGS
jgi:hypothetical protein